MTTGIRIHPRMFVVRAAELDIGKAISIAALNHNLTEIEVVSILLNEAQRYQKYVLGSTYGQ